MPHPCFKAEEKHCSLKAKLREKDKLIPEFSTVVLTQAKHPAVWPCTTLAMAMGARAAHLSPHCPSPVRDDDPTLSGPGSNTSGFPQPETVSIQFKDL